MLSQWLQKHVKRARVAKLSLAVRRASQSLPTRIWRMFETLPWAAHGPVIVGVHIIQLGAHPSEPGISSPDGWASRETVFPPPEKQRFLDRINGNLKDNTYANI